MLLLESSDEISHEDIVNRVWLTVHESVAAVMHAAKETYNCTVS